MKVSIITVNLNNRRGLESTISSILSQNYQTFEWIIIDGGSTDGSKELIEQYADNISFWVSEPDGGIYSGMNKGILASNGEYLLFLNSGDCLHNREVLNAVVPLLNGKDFYVGNIDNSTMNVELKDEKDICSLLTYSSLPHQATFTRKDLFDRYGLFREDTIIASDWWVSFNALILNNATIEKIPFVIATYDGTGISSVQKDLLIRERERLLSELPRIKCLCNFYRDNIQIIQALNASTLSFFLFRIYYWLYRHICSK